MKREGKRLKMALALLWDGSRVPLRSLLPDARAFLGKEGGNGPTAAEMARLFSLDAVAELRICWVPRLAGGGKTLAAPFSAENGKRRDFIPGKAKPLKGGCRGVIYRRPAACS